METEREAQIRSVYSLFDTASRSGKAERGGIFEQAATAVFVDAGDEEAQIHGVVDFFDATAPRGRAPRGIFEQAATAVFVEQRDVLVKVAAALLCLMPDEWPVDSDPSCSHGANLAPAILIVLVELFEDRSDSLEQCRTADSLI